MIELERKTLVSALMLALMIALPFTTVWQGAAAQSPHDVPDQVLMVKELHVADETGRTRIRLRVIGEIPSIELLDTNGDVIWQASPPESIDSSEIAGQNYPQLGEGHWVQTVLDAGRLIILEDGSKWEIATSQRTETVLWPPTSPITITKGETPLGDFQYILTNREADTTAEARFIGY